MPRSFAIIPAAGQSTRMGQPKLLLPIAGRPLILHTLAAWQASKVDCIVAVVRADDVPLADCVRDAGAELVVPVEPPPDMKASLVCGLGHVAACYKPDPCDSWLVAPADMPGLAPAIIDRLIDVAATTPGTVLIPTISGRRGHPVLLPWPLAGELPRLAENEGLGDLIRRQSSRLVPCDDVAATAFQAFADIDTPADLVEFANSKSPPTN
jgi:molybdenum cofactor cytidylyltransferase